MSEESGKQESKNSIASFQLSKIHRPNRDKQQQQIYDTTSPQSKQTPARPRSSPRNLYQLHLQEKQLKLAHNKRPPRIHKKLSGPRYRTMCSQSPGRTFSIGGHKVEYEAADEAGWTTKCIFTVVLRPEQPQQ